MTHQPADSSELVWKLIFLNGVKFSTDYYRGWGEEIKINQFSVMFAIFPRQRLTVLIVCVYLLSRCRCFAVILFAGEMLKKIIVKWKLWNLFKCLFDELWGKQVWGQILRKGFNMRSKQQPRPSYRWINNENGKRIELIGKILIYFEVKVLILFQLNLLIHSFETFFFTFD